MARPLGGGGGKGRAIKEKELFLNFYFYFVAKFQRPLSLGEGVKALMARPLREELFFAASLKILSVLT